MINQSLKFKEPIGRMNLHLRTSFVILILSLFCTKNGYGQACGQCNDDVVEIFLTSDVEDVQTGPVPGDEICYAVRVRNYEGVSITLFDITFSNESLRLSSTNTTIGGLPGFVDDNITNEVFPDVLNVAYFPVDFFVGNCRADSTAILEVCFEVIGDVGEEIRVDLGAKQLDADFPSFVKFDSIENNCPQVINEQGVNISEFGIVGVSPETLPQVIRSTCENGLEVTSNVRCGSIPGRSDGSAELQIFCGVGPYNIIVDAPPAITTSDSVYLITGLSSDAPHAISVTDMSDGSSFILQVDIPQTPGISIDSTLIDINEPPCSIPSTTPRGEILFNNSISGGTTYSGGQYRFDWGGGENGVGYIPRFFGSEVYTVLISDSLGCTIEETFDLRVDPITVIPTPNQSRCIGVNTATVAVEAMGGRSNPGNGYRFFIQGVGLDGVPYDDRVASQTNTSSFINVPAGTYNVWAEDDDNQSGLCAIMPFMTEITVEQNYSISTATATGAGCGPGESGITIDVNRTEDDPTNQISYQINRIEDDGSLTLMISETPTSQLSITECLPLGDYEITLEDNEGCGIIDSFMVDGCSLDVVELIVPLECANFEDAAISLTILESTDPVTFNWSNGETTKDIVNLGVGTYSVEVSDAALCTLMLGPFVIEPAPSIEITLQVDSIGCPGGSTDITAILQGGEAPFQFAWSPDPSGTTTGAVLLGATAGSYRVTITDDFGCEVIDSISLGDAIAPVAMVERGPIGPSCEGAEDGFVNISVAQTTRFPGPFIFTSSSGTMLTQPFSVEISNLPGGRQWVLYETLDGCVFDSIILDVPLGGGLQIDDVASTIPEAQCFGDEVFVSLQAIGGGATTEFEWPDGTVGQFYAATAGEYIVTLTSASCISTDTVFVLGPDSLQIAVDPNLSSLPLCSDDLADLVASSAGGTGDVSFVWLDENRNSLSTDSIANGLGGGMYTLTGTDERGCPAVNDTFEVVINDAVLGAIQTPLQPFCFGDPGQVFLDTSSIEGGTGPYRYFIDTRPHNETTDTISLPSSDNEYTAIIVDRNGCRSEPETFMINTPEEVSVGISGDMTLDLGTSGEIEANLISTSPLDTIMWSSNTEDGLAFECLTSDCTEIGFTPINDLTITATITNEDGCDAMSSIDIDVIRNQNIYIPNIFSPGAGNVTNSRNTVFQIFPGSGVESIDFMRIYDKWGNLIHEEEDIPVIGNDMGSGSWDGTNTNIGGGKTLESGVYVYVVQVRFLGDPEPQIRKGDITLVR